MWISATQINKKNLISVAFECREQECFVEATQHKAMADESNDKGDDALFLHSHFNKNKRVKELVLLKMQ